MSFVSLADACRQLGIDAKTLRRWLGQAQVSLQSDAADGRKKGVSGEQLQQLAALHHRALPILAPATPLSAAGPLPAALQSLCEQVASMQGQISALQQQVAELSHLLHAQIQPPARSEEAKPQAPPAHPAATPVRKPTHVLARLEYVGEGQYVVISASKGLLALQADSSAWFAWLSQQSAFRFVGQQGHFTAHYYAPGGTRVAWRAHRNIRNHTCNLRLGRTNELSAAVLEHAAAQFQDRLK
jgi:hypothetical protein